MSSVCWLVAFLATSSATAAGPANAVSWTRGQAASLTVDVNLPSALQQMSGTQSSFLPGFKNFEFSR
jgi:hypothetical protein